MIYEDEHAARKGAIEDAMNRVAEERASQPLNHRIVAEVTKNWPQGSYTQELLLSQRFENVIAVNHKRGYQLESWQFQSFPVPAQGGVEPGIVETIIAVFVRGEVCDLPTPARDR